MNKYFVITLLLAALVHTPVEAVRTKAQTAKHQYTYSYYAPAATAMDETGKHVVTEHKQMIGTERIEAADIHEATKKATESLKKQGTEATDICVHRVSH